MGKFSISLHWNCSKKYPFQKNANICYSAPLEGLVANDLNTVYKQIYAVTISYPKGAMNDSFPWIG